MFDNILQGCEATVMVETALFLICIYKAVTKIAKNYTNKGGLTENGFVALSIGLQKQRGDK